MPPAGFEPTISAGERPETYALDGAAIGTGLLTLIVEENKAPMQRGLLTYLLTPWSRVLLEKLTGFQLIQKFPSFYGT